jgi:hypothetical protein
MGVATHEPKDTCPAAVGKGGGGPVGSRDSSTGGQGGRADVKGLVLATPKVVTCLVTPTTADWCCMGLLLISTHTLHRRCDSAGHLLALWFNFNALRRRCKCLTASDAGGPFWANSLPNAVAAQSPQAVVTDMSNMPITYRVTRLPPRTCMCTYRHSVVPHLLGQ